MSFIADFIALQKTTPRLSIVNSNNSENSLYTNYATFNRNCYLGSGTHYSEDVYYSRYCMRLASCVDCLDVEKSELLYECVFCEQCYDCAYCELVFNSHDCFGCIGRNHAEYEILNEKFEKSAYFKKVAQLKTELSAEGKWGEMIIPPTYPFEDTIASQYYNK